MKFAKFIPWRRAAAATFVSAALLAACGGGGGDSAAGAASAAPITTTTGTVAGATGAATVSDAYSLGAISGFGSIVVGGVRYDDSSATVTDEDGTSHNRSALKLGMTVQVNAGVVTRSSVAGTSSATSVARSIRFGSDILGPIASINSSASTLVVLGQTVTLTSATVFDDTLVGGLAALSAGSVIEVHGMRDSVTGNTVATRIEPKASATSYRLRGTVAALDTTAKTFKIGSETVNYASVSPAPTGLADGQTVRVALQTAQVAGAWVATALKNGTRAPDTTTVREAHVEGLITAFTSSTAFTVNGLLVDASNATFPDGSAGVVLGARVEVTGSVSNGTLVATQVEMEDVRDHGRRGMELHGDITSIATSAKTFVLRGVTVSYSGTVTYKNGVEADLAAGKAVEVKGVLSSDRTRMDATGIEFRTTASTTGTTG